MARRLLKIISQPIIVTDTTNQLHKSQNLSFLMHSNKLKYIFTHIQYILIHIFRPYHLLMFSFSISAVKSDEAMLK